VTATLRLPRGLASVANTDLSHQVEGDTLAGALDDLFEREPGLRNHILDEEGRIRPHVSMFVDRDQAGLTAPVRDGAEIHVLNAVSGGRS
jgi:molybdopterin converting factor small subunit